MIGRIYLLRGEPATVLARWQGHGCPRNVLLRLADGSKTVRPFRGLKRPATRHHHRQPPSLPVRKENPPL